MDLQPQKIRTVIEVLDEILTGQYKIEAGKFDVKIKSQGKINIELSRKDGNILVKFQEPRPKVETDGPLFFDFDGTVNYAVATRNMLIVYIDGLPDLKIPIVE